MNTLILEEEDFKIYFKFNREPIQRSQHWANVVSFSGSGQHQAVAFWTGCNYFVQPDKSYLRAISF